MKTTRLLIVFSLIFLCLFGVCSCEKLPTLAAPESLSVEQATLTLSWDGVKDARLYTLSVKKDGEEAKEFIASKTSYSLVGLEEGSYAIKIRANGKDGVSVDSPWSEQITFIRDKEPGMVFTMINDGAAYEITSKGSATGNIIIPDSYRGLPVVSIADKAFFNKSDVTGIIFGEKTNVKSIGAYAFANCSYITSIALPENLEYLGSNAFASCRLLAGEVVIPGGVKEIPAHAFAYCAQISSVKFSEGVESIGKMAFTDCTGIKSVKLPDSLKTIGDYAFAVCDNIEELTFGKNLEAIGNYVFSGCPKIAKVTIPDKVKTIGEGAFFECEALAEINLGVGVEVIDAGAFHSTKIWEQNPGENEVYVGKWLIGMKDTSALTLNIRPDTIGIANFTFVNNKSLVDVRLPGSIRIIGEGAFANSSELISFVLGSGVEVIGQQAFISCKKLANVFLGSLDSNNNIEFSSLKTIDSYAFQECSNLTSIIIPSSVEIIGSYAFKDSGLSAEDGVIYAGNWVVGYADDISGEVTVKDGTVGIANYAFYDCESLGGIKLPSSVKTVGRAAFYDCSALSSVQLPDMLEVIEDYTFYRCVSLKLFTLPPLLKSIGRSAFYKCASSASLKDSDTEGDTFIIPDSVEYIGDFAFYSCSIEENIAGNMEYYGIDEIIVGAGVKSIGANAFYSVSSLKKLTLRGGVEAIGEKAFYKCVSLAEIDFGDLEENSLKTIGVKAFYKCESLTRVKLPNSVTTVSDYAFYKCITLGSADLGNGVTSIGNFAFYGDWEIKNIYLPTSLKSVGRQAFRNCDKLESVILSSGIEVMNKHAFYGCDNLTIYTELSSTPEGWEKHWNSSYRPVIWNCTLSEDKDYVISFEMKDNGITNKNETNTLSAPVREGYSFGGWGTNSSTEVAEFTMETLPSAEVGRKVFAIWDELAAE